MDEEACVLLSDGPDRESPCEAELNVSSALAWPARKYDQYWKPVYACSCKDWRPGAIDCTELMVGWISVCGMCAAGFEAAELKPHECKLRNSFYREEYC